jgi:predicted metal-binding membrane protein
VTGVASESAPGPDLPGRERFFLLAALGLLAALAWAYLLHHGSAMSSMEMHARDGLDFAMILAVWIVMMLAMMLPSVAPAVLVHAAVSRRLADIRERRWRSVAFLSGYALSWSSFSLVAAALQVWLERLALLSPALVDASPVLGGLVVAAAGVYQLTPAKDVCLRHCRTPLQFVAEHWRPGLAGALRMGAWHGLYCIGCCGALMALLFVVGVMNLAWVAVIAAFVLLEKIAFAGTRAGRFSSGLALVAAGIVLIAA